MRVNGSVQQIAARSVRTIDQSSVNTDRCWHVSHGDASKSPRLEPLQAAAIALLGLGRSGTSRVQVAVEAFSVRRDGAPCPSSKPRISHHRMMGIKEGAIDLNLEYREPVDRYFWLRDGQSDERVATLKKRVAAVMAAQPRSAFMLLDPAMAGTAHNPQAIIDALPALPPVIAGIDIHGSLGELASVLIESPPAPVERKDRVETAMSQLNREHLVAALAEAVSECGFAFPEGTKIGVDVAMVFSGVPLGGLTGETVDDQPICLVAIDGLDPSTLAESIVHEALHAVDMLSDDADSLIAQLRSRPDGSGQLWHVPFFIAAANAVRHVIDADHVDYGHAHGYYPKVPTELETLAELGIAPGRSLPG